MSLEPRDAGDRPEAAAHGERETVGFDDIYTSSAFYVPVENGYAGLDWANFDALNYYVYAGDAEPSGFQNGCTSPFQVGFNGGAEPCSVYIANGRFTLDSVNLAAAWDLRLKVEITAYRGGVEVYDAKVRVTDQAPTHFDLGLRNVDEVRFTSLHGAFDPNMPEFGDNIVFDDFVFSRIKGSAAMMPRAADHLAIAPPLPAEGHHPGLALA